MIKKYLKATYNYDSYLIEYGGDQAFPVAIEATDTGHSPFLASRYTFMVCCIEPENHIHILTEAMSQQIR